MVIAFLDLLGFTSLLQNNISTAKDNLDIFNTMLRTRFIDERSHPIENYDEKNGLREFARNSSITSFDYLISVSDSLIIGSSDADLFVRQVSNFLSSAFITYAKPFETPFADISAVMSDSRVELTFDNSLNPEIISHKAFPLLFRGGITCGNDISFNKEGSIWNKVYELNAVNVTGLDYVRAIKLESSGAGPRLFCDKRFFDELSDISVKKALRYVDQNLYEIVWTYFGCEATECTDDCNTNVLKRVNSFFLPRAINLYQYYKSQVSKNIELQFDMQIHSIYKHYTEFIKLICRGIYKYTYDKNGNKELIAYSINKRLDDIKFGWQINDDELNNFKY